MGYPLNFSFLVPFRSRQEWDIQPPYRAISINTNLTVDRHNIIVNPHEPYCQNIVQELQLLLFYPDLLSDSNFARLKWSFIFGLVLLMISTLREILRILQSALRSCGRKFEIQIRSNKLCLDKTILLDH